MLPEAVPDEHAAPLLCAGIIGYRALRAAAVPPGGALGIYGFGGSAHLAAQLALAEGHAGARAAPGARPTGSWRCRSASTRSATRPTSCRRSRWTAR